MNGYTNCIAGKTGLARMRVWFALVFVTVVSAGMVALPGYGVAAADRLDTFNLLWLDDIPYISLVELAETYHLAVSWEPVTTRMSLERGGRTITVADGSRVASVNGFAKNMLLPARMIRGTLFAPVRTFLPLMAGLVPANLEWVDGRRAVRVSGQICTIQKVRFENLQNGTLVCIEMTEPLKHQVEMRDGNWLTVSFAAGSFDPETLYEDTQNGLVEDVRAFQREGAAQIAFRLSEQVADHTVSSAATSNEMLISLFKTPQTVPAAVAEPEPLVPEAPVFDDKIWRIDTVIIDPGHGGRDSGAVGRGKTKEKDVVLKVALELRELFKKRGDIKVVLTRDTDKFITLRQRAEIAHKNNGKLFISIHANAAASRRSPTAQGLEVFFLSAAKTEDALEVARRENAVIEFEEDKEYYINRFGDPNMSRELNEIQRGIASSVFLTESQDMASILLDSCAKATKLKNRGVKQANFYVMRGTQAIMPSVLFEIGFISHPAEEKLLSRSTYQKRLAQAIYDAVTTFKERHERGLFSRSD